MAVRAVKPERPLNTNEQRLLAIYREAALEARPKPPIDDLAFELGVANGGTIPEITRRLENMGLIEVDRWQRSSRSWTRTCASTAQNARSPRRWKTGRS